MCEYLNCGSYLTFTIHSCAISKCRQGEPRQATASSVYFSLLAFLYVWLASVTTLTALPQVSAILFLLVIFLCHLPHIETPTTTLDQWQFLNNYNIITAAALLFYMVFASICTLLLGRLLIRGAYYIWLFWRFGGGNGSNSLESRLRGVLNAVSSVVWPVQSIQERRVKSASNGIKVKGPFPVLIAFQ